MSGWNLPVNRKKSAGSPGFWPNTVVINLTKEGTTGASVPATGVSLPKSKGSIPKRLTIVHDI